LSTTISHRVSNRRKREFNVLTDYLGHDEAVRIFSNRYSAPFGLERAVRYEVNTLTGDVKMAGVVWRPDSPEAFVTKKVLAAMVDERFNNPRDVMTFNIGPVHGSTEELQHTIEVFTYELGMTSHSKRFRDYRRRLLTPARANSK
jgi:hypothetical protein